MKKMLFIKTLRQVTKQNARFNHVSASRLFLEEFGDPQKTVKKENFNIDLSNMEDNKVLVRMIQSPINPADINTIQGVYGVKPKLPFTLGNEGFGQVEQTGKAVKHLKVGDWVLPATNAWGTWRSHALAAEESLFKIPNDIQPSMAATLAVNPCTAYRMLHDFEKLEKGDVILQNAANSAVGQHVIQIAHNLGHRTVNIIRNREGVDKLKDELSQMGADYVLTEEELRGSTLFKTVLPAPKLVLNCVSGKAVIELIKAMAENGTLVTYGGMSRQPLVVPASAFIFKNIRLVGYWMTRWNWLHKNSKEREEMFEALCDMSRKGALRPPKHELVHIDDYQKALAKASDVTGFHNVKFIFTF